MVREYSGKIPIMYEINAAKKVDTKTVNVPPRNLLEIMGCYFLESV